MAIHILPVVPCAISAYHIMCPNEGITVPEGYVEQTYKEVQRMFTYSGRILFHDYYRKIGLEPGQKVQ